MARLCISRTARLIKSGCCRKALNVSTIRWRNLSIFWGEVENTLSLRYPYRKKSDGFKSGERGGHSTSWPKPMTQLFPNTLSFDPLLQWGDELERCLAPTKDHETYPPNAGFQNAQRVVEKRIRLAIEDRPFRWHFHRKSRALKSHHCRRVLPRHWVWHGNRPFFEVCP